MLSDRCLSVGPVCPVCNVRALWTNGWMDRAETCHAGRPRPRTHCVRWGPSSPSPKGHSHQFAAHICCGQMAPWIKMPLGMEVGLGPGDFVLDVDTAPPPQKGGGPKFSPMIIVAKQLDGSIGTEIGLISSVDFVLDGDQPPSPKKGRSRPIFGPCLLRPTGCMDQDATWYRCRPRPRRHCVRWGPSSPNPAPLPKIGAEPLPNFRPMCIAAKRLHGSRYHLHGTGVGLGPDDIVLDGDPAPRGVTTAGDTGDASPVRPTMSPLHQNDNRQFIFGTDF